MEAKGSKCPLDNTSAIAAAKGQTEFLQNNDSLLRCFLISFQYGT